MAPKSLNTFQAFALEQLQRAQATTAKRMFGGVGLYHAGRFFALMDDAALWLKVDDSNRADFEGRGMGPFHPFGEAGPVMHYWQLPEDVLEDVEELRRWCDKAIAIAGRARAKPAKKPAKKPARKPAKKPAKKPAAKRARKRPPRP